MIYAVFVFGIVLCYFWIYVFRKELKMKEWQLLLFVVYTFIVGGVFAFLLAKLEQFLSPVHFVSNLRIYGPVYFMWAAYLLAAKLTHNEPKRFVDLCTPGLIIALIAIRLNCFHAGCCIGKIIPGTTIRYPIRELELVFQVIMLVYVAKKDLNGNRNGTLYPQYVMWYGIIRFIYEFFREPENLFFGTIHAPHVWSAIAIIAGGIAFFKMNHIPAKRAKKSTR